MKPAHSYMLRSLRAEGVPRDVALAFVELYATVARIARTDTSWMTTSDVVRKAKDSMKIVRQIMKRRPTGSGR